MNTISTNTKRVAIFKRIPSLGFHSRDFILLILLLIFQGPTLKASEEITSLQSLQASIHNQSELAEALNNPQTPISDRKNRQLQRIVKIAKPILLRTFNDPHPEVADIVEALKISTALRLKDKEFLEIYINCLKRTETSISKEASVALSKLLADDLMLLERINRLSFKEHSYPFAKYEILASYANADSTEAQAMLIQYLYEILRNELSLIDKQELSTSVLTSEIVKKQLIDKLSALIAKLNWDMHNVAKIERLLADANLYLRFTPLQTQFPNHDIYLLNPILVRWMEELGQKKFLFRSQLEDVVYVFQLIHKNKNNSPLNDLLKIQLLKIAVHKKQLNLSEHMMIAQVLKSFIHTKLNDYLSTSKNPGLENIVLLINKLSDRSIISSDPENSILLQKSITKLIKNQRLTCQKIYH